MRFEWLYFNKCVVPIIIILSRPSNTHAIIYCHHLEGSHKSTLKIYISLPVKWKKSVGPRVLFRTSGLVFGCTLVSSSTCFRKSQTIFSNLHIKLGRWQWPDLMGTGKDIYDKVRWLKKKQTYGKLTRPCTIHS